MLDVAYALDQLLPAALYSGSLTANTESAYNAITWNDGRTKPLWSAIIAVPEYVPPAYDNSRSQFDRLVEQLGTDTTESETGLNIQDNGLISSAEVAGADTAFFHSREGVLYWQQYTFRDEGGEFLYPFWSEQDQNDVMAISTGGRIGVNKPTNWLDYHAMFTGTGLDDLSVGGIYTQSTNRVYEISITGTGTPNQFKWRASEDGGSTWGSLSAAINCSLTAVDIEYGVTVAFGATTGHTLADYWRLQATAQLPDGSLSVFPARWIEVLKTADYTSGSPTYTDVTADANSTAGAIVQPFSASTTGALYVGSASRFNSCRFNLAVAGVNLTMVAEFWNGEAWTTLTAGAHKFMDGTLTGGANTSLGKSGTVRWEKGTMTGWVKRYPPNISEEGYELYWIRFRTSTAPSTPAQLLNVTRHGDRRLAVYSAPLDFNPSLYVDSVGRFNLQNQDTNTAKALALAAAPTGYVSQFAYADRPYLVNKDGILFAPGNYRNTYVVKATANTSNATTGYIDATGLSFSVLANTTYYFRFEIVYQSTNVSSGIGFAVNGPTIGTGKVLRWFITGRNFTVNTGYDMCQSLVGYDAGDVSANVGDANTDLIATTWGTLVTGATAGTFALRFKSETTNSVSVRIGSMGVLWELN